MFCWFFKRLNSLDFYWKISNTNLKSCRIARRHSWRTQDTSVERTNCKLSSAEVALCWSPRPYQVQWRWLWPGHSGPYSLWKAESVRWTGASSWTRETEPSGGVICRHCMSRRWTKTCASVSSLRRWMCSRDGRDSFA